MIAAYTNDDDDCIVHNDDDDCIVHNDDRHHDDHSIVHG